MLQPKEIKHNAQKTIRQTINYFIIAQIRYRQAVLEVGIANTIPMVCYMLQLTNS